MEQLTKLLELSVTEANFDAGHIEMPREGVSISYASRTQEIVAPDQLAEMIGRKGWEAEDYHRASRALLIIRDELFSELERQVRRLLDDYINASTDRIGHSFPTGERQESYSGYTDAVQNLHSWTSPVVSFAKALVKGAAVVGPETVASQLLRWREGRDPVRYRTAALLNGVAFRRPLSPLVGVDVEPLPLSANELPVHLPTSFGMSAKDYLGRTVLYIQHEASPALFRPVTVSPEEIVAVQDVAGIDFDTACKALSLESDTNVETAFYWCHYQGIPGLSRVTDGGSWSFGGQRYERWPLTTRGGLTDQFHATEGILQQDGTSVPMPTEEQFRDTLMAIKPLGSDHPIRTAISRWMKSKDRRQGLGDCFIDIRIALESLYLKEFLNEHSQEMRFRLPLFGAWHLGSNLGDRKRIRKRLREAYDVASGSVHSGVLAYTPENRALLSDAQGLCRRGILRILREGPPHDWGELILGAGEDADSA